MKPETFRRSLLWLSLVCFALGLLCLSAIAAEAQTVRDRGSPWWATSLAVAGPLADGLSTRYAMQQPGVREINPVYPLIFGDDVNGDQIMAVKVAQAVVIGTVVHQVGKTNRKQAIGIALVSAAIHFSVSAWNVRQAQQAQRRHRGTP